MSRKAHLTEAQRQQVRDWAKAGMTVRQIVNFLTDVTPPTVYKILGRTTRSSKAILKTFKD